MTFVTLMVQDADKKFVDLSLSATDANSISENYKDEFGQITLSATPRQEAAGEEWEFVVDLNIEDARIMRDTLSTLIEYLLRHPR